ALVGMVIVMTPCACEAGDLADSGEADRVHFLGGHALDCSGKTWRGIVTEGLPQRVFTGGHRRWRRVCGPDPPAASLPSRPCRSPGRPPVPVPARPLPPEPPWAQATASA